VHHFGVHINKIIKFVFLTNSAYSFGHGFVMPFLAVFASTRLEGGNIAVASIASGIFLSSIGISQLAGGRALDIILKNKQKGTRRMFYIFSARYLFAAIVFASLLLVTSPWQLYLNQAFLGIFIGSTQPFANVIQTKYMDKGEEGLEWGINGFVFHICAGISAFLAGFIIAQFGFSAIFALGSVFHFIAFFLAIQTFREYKKRLPS